MNEKYPEKSFCFIPTDGWPLITESSPALCASLLWYTRYISIQPNCIVVVPINHNNHWLTGIIQRDTSGIKLFIYNSIQSTQYPEVSKHLIAFAATLFESTMVPKDVLYLKGHDQKDSFNCGIFVLKFVEKYLDAFARESHCAWDWECEVGEARDLILSELFVLLEDQKKLSPRKSPKKGISQETETYPSMEITKSRKHGFTESPHKVAPKPRLSSQTKSHNSFRESPKQRRPTKSVESPQKIVFIGSDKTCASKTGSVLKPSVNNRSILKTPVPNTANSSKARKMLFDAGDKTGSSDVPPKSCGSPSRQEADCLPYLTTPTQVEQIYLFIFAHSVTF